MAFGDSAIPAPNRGERLRTLEHHRFVPGPADGDRGREAANPATRDEDAHVTKR